ncbi:MAG TPA: phosphopentomutase, partial [Thermoanaerobacterium sp.]|nr:phosphopentomutase [Thermoanaerobacterium sp.]
MFDRVIIIVMDSVGIGELPDAHLYGDNGANTLGHIYRNIEGFSLPTLEKLGIGNIQGTRFIKKSSAPVGCYGRAAEKSKGKDTITGHWEITGIILDKPFPTYPNGFPADLISRFEKLVGRRVLGNKAASGTEIIEELGAVHMETGYPIVYTSADSVFQIAAHEEIVPVEDLYKMCETAREMLTGEHRVARVIARPFVGKPGLFTRTAKRRDYSVEPPAAMLLDHAVEQGYCVTAVGKIYDIFAGRGISRHVHTGSNRDGLKKTKDYINENGKGIIFTNLVDFDMKYGHRNNVEGYGAALREFDNGLCSLLNCLKEKDLLILTADHGCDPTTDSTDHSREYVPILAYG